MFRGVSLIALLVVRLFGCAFVVSFCACGECVCLGSGSGVCVVVFECLIVALVCVVLFDGWLND